MSSWEPGVPSDNNYKSSRSKTEQHTNHKKCMNEKRRREQETAFMEELADYISGTVNDVSKAALMKQDKCAILHETVTQVRDINIDHGIPDSTDIQLSQVSSSKPSPAILHSDVVGPLILQALNGFMFMVNTSGILEFVSAHVCKHLLFTQEELFRKNVYEIIHPDDRVRMAKCIESLTSGSSKLSSKTNGKGFNCRMLVKNADSFRSERSRYENCNIICTTSAAIAESDGVILDSRDGASQVYLLCIARRIEIEEKTHLHQLQQFTTKQDVYGCIQACDPGSHSLDQLHKLDLVGKNIVELCHSNDRGCLTRHYEQVTKTGSNTSGVYRFHLSDERYVFIQTNSKLFKNPTTHLPEFVMSTHSVVRDCEGDNELIDSASASLMKAMLGPHSTSRNVFSTLKDKPTTSSSLAPSNSANNTTLDLLTSLGFKGNLTELLNLLPSGDCIAPTASNASSSGVSSGISDGLLNSDVPVFDELFAMFHRQTSSLKRPSVSVSNSSKRQKLVISELGNCHLSDLLGNSSTVQLPQSTTCLDSSTPDSSTSLTVDTNPLLKQLLTDNENTETPANEAEPAHKEFSRNLLLKQLLDGDMEKNKPFDRPVKLLKQLLLSDSDTETVPDSQTDSSDTSCDQVFIAQEHPDSSTASDGDVISSSNSHTPANQLLKKLLLMPECSSISRNANCCETSGQTANVNTDNRTHVRPGAASANVSCTTTSVRSETCASSKSSAMDDRHESGARALNIRRRTSPGYNYSAASVRPGTASCCSSAASVRPGTSASFSSNATNGRLGARASCNSDALSSRRGVGASFGNNVNRVSSVASTSLSNLVTNLPTVDISHLGNSDINAACDINPSSSFHQASAQHSNNRSSSSLDAESAADSCFDDLFINLPSVVVDDELILKHVENMIMSKELSLDDLESLLSNNTQQDIGVNQVSPKSANTVSLTAQGPGTHRAATVHHMASMTFGSNQSQRTWPHGTDAINTSPPVMTRESDTRMTSTNHYQIKESQMTGKSPSLLAMERTFADWKSDSSRVYNASSDVSNESVLMKQWVVGSRSTPQNTTVTTNQMPNVCDIGSYRNCITGTQSRSFSSILQSSSTETEMRLPMSTTGLSQHYKMMPSLNNLQPRARSAKEQLRAKLCQRPLSDRGMTSSDKMNGAVQLERPAGDFSLGNPREAVHQDWRGRLGNSLNHTTSTGMSYSDNYQGVENSSITTGMSFSGRLQQVKGNSSATTMSYNESLQRVDGNSSAATMLCNESLQDVDGNRSAANMYYESLGQVDGRLTMNNMSYSDSNHQMNNSNATANMSFGGSYHQGDRSQTMTNVSYSDHRGLQQNYDQHSNLSSQEQFVSFPTDSTSYEVNDMNNASQFANSVLDELFRCSPP